MSKLDNMVIVWNTVYMGEIIKNLEMTNQLPENVFSKISPVRFEHIIPLGEYRFEIGEPLSSNGLRKINFQ